MITPNPQKKLLPLAGPLPVQTLSGNWEEKGIRLQVLRLDLLHPVVSGNKIFKLQPYLESHLRSGHRTLITFGGPWSNHLVATAFACRQPGIACAAVVRGEAPAQWSATLLQCRDEGMQLHFVSRQQFALREDPAFVETLEQQYGPATLVPEGGYGPEGAAGAAEICSLIPADVTHLCCAAGTGTTAAGLCMGMLPHQALLIIPALKGLNDLQHRVETLSGRPWDPQRVSILDDYHGGGYARLPAGLTDLMNQWYTRYQLPTDFVYTAKMMRAVLDLLEKSHFPPGSRVLCIHSGGLQGNRSLPPGQLCF